MGEHRGRRRASRRDSGSRAALQQDPSTGRRRAPIPATPRRRRPSLPLLVGVAALAVAGVGAVTVPRAAGQQHEARQSVYATQAGALTGVGGTSSVSSSRREAQASRDSSRQAQADAADRRVEAATEKQAEQHSASLAAIAEAAEKQARKMELNLWVLPASGYHLTARFGQSSGLWSSVHTGLDFAAPSGTPIHAVASGTVVSTGYDGSYGNKTVVRLTDGTEIWYCHQNAFAVSAGDTVAQGELIGYVGSTGNTTGPHLHLEVRPGGGDPVDPYAALVAHGVTP